MKCCASPTTSTVGNAAADVRSATKAIQAIIFGEILKPLSAGLGPVGETVVASVAASLFAPSRS